MTSPLASRALALALLATAAAAPALAETAAIDQTIPALRGPISELADDAGAPGPDLAGERVRHPILDVEPGATGSVTALKNAFLRLAPDEAEGPGVLAPIFKRIASDARQLRFEGEMGVNDLPVYIRHDQMTEAARLRVRYLSAVSVMPEASRLVVSVNDQPLATIVLDSTSEPGVAEIDIPPGLLQVGYNVVRFNIQQRHRVDCSIEAANELWTQIDLAGTGLALLSTNDQFSTVDDLIGFPEGEDGATAITVVLAPGADLAAIDQSLRAVQALTIRADIQKPKVRFSRSAPTAPGIHLYVGARGVLRSLGVDGNSISESNLVVAGRSSSIARVFVTGDSAEEVATTITRLSSEGRGAEKRGTTAGLRALAYQRGAAIGPENEIALSAFGLSTQDFSGRTFRTSFNLVLPPDFYPADNGKAVLFLDGEYAAGLLTSNEAIVRVNGKIVGASRLTRSGGETVNRRAIEITLRALQPGHNRVTLEVRTATDADRDCNPLSLIDSRRRLTIQSTTSFVLPRIARAEFLPNLGAATTTAYPYALATQVTLFMPKADTAALGAAATLLARTAVASGRPVTVRTSLRAPDEKTGSALVVGAFSDIPEPLFRQFAIRGDVIPANWKTTGQRRGPTPALVSEAPQGRPVRTAALPARTVTDASPAPSPAAPTPEAPAEIHWIDRTLAATSRFLQRNIGYSADQLWFLNRGRSSVVASPASTLLLAQGKSPLGGRESWLLLTAQGSEELQRDTAELVSPAIWRDIQGRMVAFDPESRALTLFPPGDDDFIRPRERSFSNVTLFAAGWLSNHIQYYVLVLISVCVIFGIFSRKLLNRIGQKP